MLSPGNGSICSARSSTKSLEAGFEGGGRKKRGLGYVVKCRWKIARTRKFLRASRSLDVGPSIPHKFPCKVSPNFFQFSTPGFSKALIKLQGIKWHAVVKSSDLSGLWAVTPCGPVIAYRKFRVKIACLFVCIDIHVSLRRQRHSKSKRSVILMYSPIYLL